MDEKYYNYVFYWPIKYNFIVFLHHYQFTNKT